MQDTTTQRYRLWRRHGKVYYAFDRQTGKQISLGTRDKTEALRLLNVRNEAEANPLLNRQIARAYLAASDPAMLTRTWRHALEELAKTQADENALRWAKVSNDKALGTLLDRPLIDTRPEHLLNVMQVGKVSTNVFLRRIHNCASDMEYLLKAVIPKPQWWVCLVGNDRQSLRDGDLRRPSEGAAVAHVDCAHSAGSRRTHPQATP